MGLLEELRGEAESTATEKTLASVELVNTTPALVGSWDATGYVRCSGSGCHPDLCIAEPPRPTDIAGKTRWWLRAILAAGYYEAHQGFPSLDRLDQLASRILGSTREASRYIIALEAYTPRRVCIPSTIVGDPQRCRETTSRLLAEQCCSPSCISIRVLKDCASPAAGSRRARLAILGHKGVEGTKRLPLPPGFYRFRLRVEERPAAQRSRGHGIGELEQRLLGTALAMALFFTGIGRMTTRGYGKLAPLAWSNTGTPLEEAMKETWKLLTDEADDTLLLRAAEGATGYAREYVDCLNHTRKKNQKDYKCVESVPDYPVFHRDFLNSCVVRLKDIDVWSLISLVNSVTRLVYIVPCSGLPPGSRAILGLPRNNIDVRLSQPSPSTARRLRRLASPLVFTPILDPQTLRDHAQPETKLFITLFRYSFLTKIRANYVYPACRGRRHKPQHDYNYILHRLKSILKERLTRRYNQRRLHTLHLYLR